MQRPFIFPLLLQCKNKTLSVKSKITGNVHCKETGHSDQNFLRTSCPAHEKWQRFASMKEVKLCVVSVLSVNNIDMFNVNDA
uniref:Uncharacterized protein n=1 Tax=Rhipicephalus zambeziensis TaxID=60191 RepID=A0A224YLD1_9ACAR